MRVALLTTTALLAGLALGRWSAPLGDAEPLAVVAQRTPEATRPVPVAATAPAQAPAQCEPTDDEHYHASSPTADTPAPRLHDALETLARTRDPQAKTRLIRDITALKAQDDLRSTWGWLAQHRADPGYAEAARNLLYHWSYDKPEDVAALLPQLGSGEAQSAAAHQLAQLWNQKDPHAYHAWVTSLPDGALKKAAASPY